ncbi:hypothetical protein [Gordonia soli]|uniref:Uncharacterized protein n=1 Tax=Gordonia soli NBRC 108243 TaxID=1223545 RepID=M0QMR4_9ACTN|nr:hypothetical protein [Gordonia soli]GAC69714.1 hypothetical protein GS4_26_01620 [Gordonia soli NBRC 108243]
MDRPSALAADGLPYVFDSFVAAGTGPAIDQLVSADPGAPVPVDRAESGPRTDQLPLGGTVVDFPTR